MNLEKSVVTRSPIKKISSIFSNDGLDKSSFKDLFRSLLLFMRKLGFIVQFNKRTLALSLNVEKLKITIGNYLWNINGITGRASDHLYFYSAQFLFA